VLGGEGTRSNLGSASRSRSSDMQGGTKAECGVLSAAAGEARTRLTNRANVSWKVGYLTFMLRILYYILHG